jgi:predicted metalloprotease
VRWKKVQGQGDMEDRRGQGGGMFGGGGGLPIPMGKGAGGLGIIIAIVAALLLGGNVLGGGGSDSGFSPGGGLQPSQPAGQGSEAARGDDDLFEFTKFVSKDAQDMWTQVFSSADRQYPRAPVVTFTSGTQTGCGPASAATGPFYCPADNKVYLDLSFAQELSRRFGAPGDFAWAYVVAHEIGHHVQAVLGIEADVRQKQQSDPGNANLYLVRLELQADCFAGVWAHSTYERGILEEGDIEEGLAAASAVGDDRLGARSPEQWTHGSAALRTEWFRKGFESGDANDCDTGSVDI